MNTHTNFRPADFLVWGVVVLFLLYAAMRPAHAATPQNATTYTSECGSCHTAYPARLLRPSDWMRVLDSLDRHYGADASLDPQSKAAVASALRIASVPVGTASSVNAPLPRITASQWFQQEHDEVPARTWASPAVKSRANCGACHADAEQGNFNEESVRIPE